MNESIIVGVVVGVVVALVSGYISHLLRKREMEALWAEEERRRKSDRRRERYETELGALRDSVDGLTGAMTKADLSRWSRGAWKPVLHSMAEAYGMIQKARLIPVPPEHGELAKSYYSLIDLYQDWFDFVDWSKDDPFEGKLEEVKRLRREIELAASDVSCRIARILKEV